MLTNNKIIALEAKLSSIYSKNGEQYQITNCINQRDIGKITSGIRNGTKAMDVFDLFKVYHIAHLPDGSKSSTYTTSVTVKQLADYQLLEVFQDALIEANTEKLEKRQKRTYLTSRNESALKDMCEDKSDKHVFITSDLDLDFDISQYNSADREFFTWWSKDSQNQLYMKLSNGKYLLVPMVEGAQRRIAGDEEFWTLFFKEHRNDLLRYKKAIVTKIWERYENVEQIDENTDQGLLGEIHNVVPKAIMDCLGYELSVLILQKKVEKETITIRIFDGVQVKARVGMSIYKNPSDRNLKIAMTEMLTLIDLSEISMMKEFTNIPGTPAKFTLSLSKYYEPRADIQLPSNWEDFFSTTFVTMKSTQLYRVAKWVRLALDANNRNRQALLLTGGGNDGKSVFTNTLFKILNGAAGSGFAKSCGEKGFEDGNTQNGLVNCLDAHIINIPELTRPSEFLGGTIFKGITGGDSITCNIKYRAPVTKSMETTKFIISTNKIAYLNEAAAYTRVCNVYFAPKPAGFAEKASYVLEGELMQQGEDFIHWCFAYSMAIDRKLELDPNRIAMTNIDYMLDNGTTVPTDIREAYEGIYGTDDIRCKYKTYDDSQQDMEDLFGKFAADYITTDANGEVSYTDLYQAWQDWILSKQYGTLVRNISITVGGKHARDFIKFIRENTNATVSAKKRDCKTVRVLKGIRIDATAGLNTDTTPTFYSQLDTKKTYCDDYE